jgi:hypothetical protein
VHLRRALLLFAIVLGLAAIAASLSRPSNQPRQNPPPTTPSPMRTEKPQLAPGGASASGPPEPLLLSAKRHETRHLRAGQPATLEVAVDEPGQVQLAALGMSSTAEPHTPARFDILVRDQGRYPVNFTPSGGDETRPAGTLIVTEPKR